MALMDFVSGLTFLNTLVNYSRYLCKEFELVMLCVNIQTRWIDQDVADVEGNINRCQCTANLRWYFMGSLFSH